MHDCLIAFGSNLGDVEANFQQAVSRLAETEGIVALKTGDPFWTKPVGGPEGQSKYLNAAIRLQTTLDAGSIHQRTIGIEQALGRERRERRERWGARKADLDILLFDDLQLESEQLIIPHPRMSFRRFVLEPARKIAGDMMHPVARLTISELIHHLDQTPKTILWVTLRTPEIRRCHERLLVDKTINGWKLHVVDNLDDYQVLIGQAKLVVSSGELLSMWGIRFQGPTLRLPQSEPHVEAEIIAAAIAMQK